MADITRPLYAHKQRVVVTRGPHKGLVGRLARTPFRFAQGRPWWLIVWPAGGETPLCVRADMVSPAPAGYGKKKVDAAAVAG